MRMVPAGLTGGLLKEGGKAPLKGATWYMAWQSGDGLSYAFPAGSLRGSKWLSADLLVEGTHLVVFEVSLREGADGPRFAMIFSALNQCSARMRIRLSAVDQNRWRFEREGAWLKPMCSGDRVDLSKVDRMAIRVIRKSDRPVRFFMTPVTASSAEPPLLRKLLLPRGKLADEVGQNTLMDWDGKSRSPAEVVTRLKSQLAAAPSARWPSSFSRWGGWKARKFRGTGFFRTHHDGKRWWLLDPDGHPFWSAGLDCVRVDTPMAVTGIVKALKWMPPRRGRFAAAVRSFRGQTVVNFLAANCIRAFGPKRWHGNWSRIALAELKRLGFNTVANWSEWEEARSARFPYVRPLDPSYRRSQKIFREFPDVFTGEFAADAAEFARQLEETRDDPAFIGYFLMNEPTWGFAKETPAAGMLFNTPRCEARRRLAEFLRRRHRSDAGLSRAWGFRTSLKAVADGRWTRRLSPKAQSDLADFSEIMCERLFTALSGACRKVDPNHLNLGARYYTVPPRWAVKGMRSFDVFSVNGYDRRVRPELGGFAKELGRPIMVGEWHFGSLDAGLPASGIGHVRDQRDRGRAFRIYTEDAAAKPWCVGVHYFTLYDEGVLGRSDGENWQIGFLDVCNRPYPELASAARAAHERLYEVATGKVPPFSEEPVYLPLLFL